MGAAAARPERAAPMFERSMKDGEAGMNVAGLPWAPPPPALAARLAAMPKVELHVHLEGAMTPETIWQLAAENGVDLPAATLDDWRRQYAFTDFNHFIETYQLATRVMRRAEDFAFMVERFGAMQTAQNVRYSEVFISTSLHLDKITPEALAEALAEGARVAAATHGVALRFIPDIARHEPQSAEAVLAFALAAHQRYPEAFIGLGLGGAEEGFPPEGFRDIYARARAGGLRCVAHAGEAAGADSVAGAVTALRAERIGHGFRVLDDPALVAQLAASQLPFEVCPVSNYRTQSFPHPDQPHPIRAMVDAGLHCTVNSDDPPMFGTSLNEEYLLLAAQGFGWEELWRLNRNALAAAFIDGTTRGQLASEWRRFERNL